MAGLLTKCEISSENVFRSAFVEMLFALSVSQVAIHTADLVSVCCNSYWEKAPAFAHLGVGLILIAASWLGWRQALSSMKESKYLFSWSSLGLLLDVLLVILYFIIVRQVEIDQKNGETILSSPSASPEAFWVYIVFAVYASWDVVTDVFDKGIPNNGMPSKVWKGIRAGFVSAFCSLVCLMLSYLVYDLAGERQQAYQVLFLDGMLFSVILIFRVLKPIENPLGRWLRVTDCEAFRKPREIRIVDMGWLLALVIFYILCVSWLLTEKQYDQPKIEAQSLTYKVSSSPLHRLISAC